MNITLPPMDRLTKYFLAVLAAVIGVAAIWLVVLTATSSQRAETFAKGGYDMFTPANPETNEKASQVMAEQSTKAVFHFVIVAALAGAIMFNLLRLKGAAKPWLRWGGCAALAFILYVEQWQANSHFVEYFSPERVYADNIVFQKIRSDSTRPRVTLLTRGGFYNTWLSLLFPYYDIDAIEMPAMSRGMADYEAFFGAIDRQPLRKWELCAVKYILGPKDNGLQIFKAQHWEDQIKDVLDFDSQFGKQAVFEYSRALPRAVVLHRWETIDDKEKLLARLADPLFDPQTTVLLDSEPPVKTDAGAPSSTKVNVVSYKQADIVLKTNLKSPGILLLNDRYTEKWTATCDGQPVNVQRGNFIMRALPLKPGDHEIVFRLTVPAISWIFGWGVWIILGVALAIGMFFRRRTA